MDIKITGATIGADAAAYAAGQLVGAKLTLTGPWRITSPEPVLCAVTVQDLAGQAVALDVLFFDANPSGTTFTDNAALDVADADLPKLVAKVSLLASDYITLADNGMATVSGLALPLSPVSGETMYACIVSQGAPTYAANSLSMVLKFIM